MVERKRTDHELYLDYRDIIGEVSEHYEDCPQQGRSAPLYACPCTCYQEQIFLLGVTVQRERGV